MLSMRYTQFITFIAFTIYAGCALTCLFDALHPPAQLHTGASSGAPPSGTLRVSKSIPDGFVALAGTCSLRPSPCSTPYRACPCGCKQGGRLWAQPCGRLSPCKLSILTICPSIRVPAMLSVAGTRQRQKSGVIIASTGTISGL